MKMSMERQFETTCPGCGQEIDPDTCGCGEGRLDERGHPLAHEGHPFIPMGCDCYRAPSPPSDYRTASRPKPRFEKKVLKSLAAVDRAIPECLLKVDDDFLAYDYAKRFSDRDTYCKTKSWAVPCSAAIARILELGPVVEMGAGNGYWAGWIAQCGGDIVAFDKNPPGQENHWCNGPAYHKVNEGSFEKLLVNRTRNLFLCWPPYDDSFAADCLKAYQGDTVIFIGEGYGGCTGDLEFFKILEESWTESPDVVSIPQWYGMHDYLFVYHRKPQKV